MVNTQTVCHLAMVVLNIVIFVCGLLLIVVAKSDSRFRAYCNSTASRKIDMSYHVLIHVNYMILHVKHCKPCYNTFKPFFFPPFTVDFPLISPLGSSIGQGTVDVARVPGTLHFQVDPVVFSRVQVLGGRIWGSHGVLEYMIP